MAYLYPHREKKLLVGSDDFGRDLTGVQNLRKKHKRLEAELTSHEPTVQNVQVWQLFMYAYIHTMLLVPYFMIEMV